MYEQLLNQTHLWYDNLVSIDTLCKVQGYSLSLGHYLETSWLIICGQYIIWYQPNCWPGYVYLMQIDIGQSSSFLWWFSPFLETYVPSQIPCFSEKKLPQKTKNIPKKIKIFVTIPYNMKGCSRFSTSKFG
jgi:hypothetical protein